MEEAEDQLCFASCSADFAPPPSVVSLSPFSSVPSPSSRRLSSHFTPSRPVPSARKLAWLSLQGRLVNAEEASSAEAIGGGLSREQTIAWELFSPVQRFLIVAVIGVAVAESKKNRIILRLSKSVELRDQVLSGMQQKLDDLCEQLNSIKNHSRAEANTLLNENVESLSSNVFGCARIKFVDCGCWHCDHHQNLFAGLMDNSVEKLSQGDEVFEYKVPLVNGADQEERRMSDLSDWASSVTSSADIQMNSSSVDLDISNLKRENEEKDATIKELSSILQSTNMAGSKRTAELEDIIRRKNTIITKLKKDIMVLEQKLVHFTRIRRPSSSPPISHSWHFPLMMENIVYDMDSSTSPSSSDSDSSPVNRPKTTDTKNQFTPVQETPLQSSDSAPATKGKSTSATASSSLAKLTEQHMESRSATPLKEISTNQKFRSLSSLRLKQLSANGEFKKIRRRSQTACSDAAPKKRWM
ncbi:hypothetical protein JCGZ_07908 [Jatropha curcas]|uniref:Uncharacterized protein n=1 Tax=Jatropha curcas TaxID=180498 RepID=A0A067JBS7_JATCU|nr:uncharacterized protein LOC105650470 [Jatropha curcas]KDP20188.1 hypothetical protein JCGZ_07908 [Jatropha curcas]